MSAPRDERRIKRVTVVTNAAAGALLAGAEAGAAGLPALFAEAGLEAAFIPNEAGALPMRIAAALATAPDALVVAGGDGTVACAAHAMRDGPDLPLGILPFGTMNLLAKDLGLPIGDTAGAVAVIAGGRGLRIDAAEVQGHAFLCAAMLGLPTNIGRHREFVRGKKRAFFLRITLAVWRGIMRLAPIRGELAVDGTTVRVLASAITVTVNAVDDGSGLRFARRRLDGGQLACYTVRPRGPIAWIGLLLRILAGRWRQAPGIGVWQGRRMVLRRLGRRATHVMLDGEMRLLQTPLVFTCTPGALTVLVP